MFSGHIGVEVGHGGMERERASLRGDGLKGTASPTQQPGWELQEGGARRSQPGEESHEKRGQDR